jgi:hypothetical protein
LSHVVAAYLQGRDRFAAAVKVPLPLGGAEALLLDPAQAAAFRAILEAARDALRAVEPAEQLGAYARVLAGLDGQPLPRRLLDRLERYLPPDAGLVFHFEDNTTTL